jgi:O-6-methylguanine DNA methyltransferase
MSWQRGFITTLSKQEIKKLIKELPWFEQQVLLKVLEIPWGETRSYKWLANAIGKPKNVRQVARALSKNPYPLIIPCHRVIRSDGSLGGYSLGVEVKRYLLDLEKRAKSVIIGKSAKRRRNARRVRRKNLRTRRKI